MTALLRLADYQTGEVLIDGVDVNSLPLKTLRAAVVAVPQDAVRPLSPMCSIIDGRGAFVLWARSGGRGWAGGLCRQ